METSSVKKGLYALGLISNLQTCLDELKDLVSEDQKSMTWRQLNDMVENSTKEFLNAAGYAQFPDGTPVTKEKAKYIRFSLEIKTSDGHVLYGWFSHPNNKPTFVGVQWGTLNQFTEMVQRSKYFTIGKNIYFEDYQEGLDFLEDIAKNTIEESWKYKNHPSQINHPILKSYIENILIRLQNEYDSGNKNKLVFSEDSQYVMFNLNLLDKFFHDVFIVGKAEYENSSLQIKNPFRATKSQKLREMGFSGDNKPEPPRFFDDVNDVIFRTNWKIDQDFDTYTHIIEERQNRFPDDYNKEEPESLARKLDDAIKYAVAMAQRNYKFIVPMYRPQEDKIQLLMPIYLRGTYSKRPDFALILTPDSLHKVYVPETILPLDAAYQNARLIAKPDDAWLNPDEL